MISLGDKVTFCVAICVTAVVIFTVGLCMTQCYVSPSSLKFQIREVVTLKIGGQGQIMEYNATNLSQGLGLTPVYSYKVRIHASDGDGTTVEWFKEWELAKLPEDTWTWPKPPLKN